VPDHRQRAHRGIGRGRLLRRAQGQAPVLNLPPNESTAESGAFLLHSGGMDENLQKKVTIFEKMPR